MGRRLGITEEQLRALFDYEGADVFSAQELGALSYADAMTATPAEVPDEVFQRLRDCFDEAQIVELTSALAWENYRARFDHALKLEAEGFSEGAFCPLIGPSPGVGTPEVRPMAVHAPSRRAAGPDLHDPDTPLTPPLPRR